MGGGVPSLTALRCLRPMQLAYINSFSRVLKFPALMLPVSLLELLAGFEPPEAA